MTWMLQFEFIVLTVIQLHVLQHMNIRYVSSNTITAAPIFKAKAIKLKKASTNQQVAASRRQRRLALAATELS